MKHQIIQDKLSQAIKMRETDQLEKSRLLFEQLIKSTKKLLKTDHSNETKDLFVSVMGEYVIQHRLEAQLRFLKALELGKQLVKFDKKHKVNNSLSLRSVSNTLIDLGYFEKAIKPLKDLIKINQGNSTRVGDNKAHLAYCLLRTGKLNQATKFIDEATLDIEANTVNISHLPVYQSYVLMVKSLIFNAKGQPKEAIKHAKEALVIARKGNYYFRIKQAEMIIETLQS